MWRSGQRSPTCCVPYSRDLNELPVNIEAIDDPIWPINDLAELWVSIFGNNPPCFRVLLQNICPSHQFIREGFCALRIIARDKANNIAQVVSRSRRPDYLASHVASCRLTSSCGIPSPRSSWSRPFWMAARNSILSAISSKETSSGNSLIVSKTSLFCVIRLI